MVHPLYELDKRHRASVKLPIYTSSIYCMQTSNIYRKKRENVLRSKLEVRKKCLIYVSGKNLKKLNAVMLYRTSFCILTFKKQIIL